MPDVHIHVRSNVSADCARLLRAVDPSQVWPEQGERKRTRMIRLLRRGAGTPPEAGQPPVSRHGAAGFAGRFTWELVDGGRTLRYGNASVQARILYLGGEIVPRNVKFLTVPVSGQARGRRAKDFPDAFVARLGGKPFLVRRKGKSGALEVLFVLKDRVVLNPHPYGLEWDDVDNAALFRALQRRVERADKEWT